MKFVKKKRKKQKMKKFGLVYRNMKNSFDKLLNSLLTVIIDLELTVRVWSNQKRRRLSSDCVNRLTTFSTPIDALRRYRRKLKLK